MEELQHLACYSLDAPYEVEAEHDVSVLLLALQASVSGEGDKDGRTAPHTGHATPSSKGGSETASTSAKSRQLLAKSNALMSTMRRVSKRITLRLSHAAEPSESNHNSEQSLRLLATLHAVALGNVAWLGTCVPAIAAFVKIPTTTNSSAPPSEVAAGYILQSCRILQTVLGNLSQLEGLAAVRPDALIADFTALMTKYVGHHQPRILRTAVGAMCATIDAQAANSTQCLRQCYQFMNLCYVRSAATVSVAHTNPQYMEQLKRLLFLLSEMLRSYSSWVRAAATLTDPSVTAPNPNRLAAGEGICANLVALVQSLQKVSSPQQLLSSIVRLVGSLCMLDPPTFLPKNEALIRKAIESQDVSLQVQGMLCLRDFLVCQEARVLEAQRKVVAANQSAAAAAAAALTPSRSSKLLKNREPSNEDANSGMGPWVIQHFFEFVAARCSSTHVAVRSLTTEVVEHALYQGLMPPALCVDVLICLSCEPERENIRFRTRRALLHIADQHADAIAAKAAAGIIRSFHSLVATGVDPLAATLLPATDLTPQWSSHEIIFRLLAKNKKYRENLLTSLARYLYSEMRLAEASEQLLCFVAMTLAMLPYSHESDVLFLLEQLRSGLDLNLQTSVEWAEREKTAAAAAAASAKQHKSKSSRSKKVTDGTAEADTTNNDETKGSDRAAAAPSNDVIKACGVVLMSTLRKFLSKEYAITATKAEKFTLQSSTSTSSQFSSAIGSRREPRSPFTAQFLLTLRQIYDSIPPTAAPSAVMAEGEKPQASDDADQRAAAHASLLWSLVEEVSELEMKHWVLQPSQQGGATAQTQRAKREEAERKKSEASKTKRKAKKQRKTHKKAEGSRKRKRDHETDEEEESSSSSCSSEESESDAER